MYVSEVMWKDAKFVADVQQDIWPTRIIERSMMLDISMEINSFQSVAVGFGRQNDVSSGLLWYYYLGVIVWKSRQRRLHFR